jgi:hypothetical protein
MLWFRCRGCEARDQEIRHLLAELQSQRVATEKATARVMEIADPGSNARMVPRPAIQPRRLAPTKTEGAGAGDSLPGYERLPLKPVYEVEG